MPSPLNLINWGLPQMGGALQSWLLAMQFTLVAKIVNGEFLVVETPTNFNFRGVWQVFTPEMLQIKPEAERSWKWFMVHADPSLILATDDVVNYRGTQYRVMEKLNYNEYEYVQYNLIEDFTGSGPNP